VENKEMTKTKLLTSTALVSAVALVGAAGANAATLKLGGFAELWIGYGDNDKIAGLDNNFDTKTDGEIYFRAEETLDNGIKAGVLFEWEAFQGNAGGNGPGAASAGDGSDGFDESFGWIKTKWGQLNVGNNDLATGYVGGVSTVGPVGIIKSDAGDWIPGTYELNNTDVDMGLGDSQNITYFTPRFMGAQLIVSYTPDNSEEQENDFDSNKSGGLHNGFSVALKYSGKFQGASFSVAGGRTTVERTDGTLNSDESEGYNASAKVSVGAATLSGAWAMENVGHGSDTDNFWGISGLYKINKATTVSIAYGKGTEDHLPAGQEDHTSYVVTGGIEHKVGKGVSFAASIFKIDGDQAGTVNDRDGVGVVGGMVIKF
jgi:hypothetical protein